MQKNKPFGTVEVRVSNFDINCLNQLRADINLVARMVQDFKDAFRRKEVENYHI